MIECLHGGLKCESEICKAWLDKTDNNSRLYDKGLILKPDTCGGGALVPVCLGHICHCCESMLRQVSRYRGPPDVILLLSHKAKNTANLDSLNISF